MEQLQELWKAVPAQNLLSEGTNINSDYIHYAGFAKNCYLIMHSDFCEDCYYGHWVLESKDVMDSLYCEFCERCYECSYCLHCFQTFHSRSCQQCRDCLFCYECKGCDRCIGCVGMRQKSLHIFNKPVTQEEFLRTKQNLLTSPEAFRSFQEQWNRFELSLPHRFALQINCTNVTGDDLYNCKNSFNCFNCRGVEDSNSIYDSGKNRSSMDTYEHGWLVQSELNYELHAGMAGYHLLFCHICAEDQELLYCDCCFNNSKHLFGCISLKNRRYCILNKQYSKEEYERLVPQIIGHMKVTREWGEFLPSKDSPFAYNESVAQEYFPLQQGEVERQGLRWRESEDREFQPQHIRVPPDIRSVTDDILQEVLACDECTKNFKVIPQELRFYRTLGIPIPVFCPECRHRRRMSLRNPRTLWKRPCMKCGKEMETTYASDRPEIVYCENCYLKEVY